jgi:carbamoyl-phosphate synthase large subunit
VTAVLFTCAGQRVDIVSAFARAGALTVAADANPLAPALYHAHTHSLVPRVDSAEYVPALRSLIREHDVKLVVPLTDLDQELLAEADLGALALVPSVEVCRAMADKHHADELLRAHGFDTPQSWLPEDVPADLPYPVLVKARIGFGSRHIYRAEDPRQLEFFLDYTPVPSIVQVVCGGEEFSIDIFCDLDGRCLNAIPRTMIESKGGESIKGMSIKAPDLIELGRAVGEALPLLGPANVQCFREPDGRLLITDVNPRFGGGFPLPLAAGSTYPELAIALAEGRRPEPRVGEFREGVLMTRFFSELTLSENGDGVLAPFSEEVPEPVAAPPGDNR